MNRTILETLENKGIRVPDHHVQPLLHQWGNYEKLKESTRKAKLADYDIGLNFLCEGEHE